MIIYKGNLCIRSICSIIALISSKIETIYLLTRPIKPFPYNSLSHYKYNNIILHIKTELQ
nr:MAG TPA: hypothetical protein [Caudoviricetes sp.]